MHPAPWWRPGPVGSVATVILAALVDLVLPMACAGCGTPGWSLCPPCATVLDAPAKAVAPRPAPPGFPPCRAVAGYTGPVPAALAAYKERGRRDLGAALGGALARAVAAHPVVTGDVVVALVPVPSRAAATRRRGRDPTSALAVAAGRSLQRAGVAARVEPALHLRRDVADSAGLGIQARQANLSGAMAADRAEPAAGRPGSVVVVVDDLVTTGATLVEATRALAEGGRPGALAAVVAATPRWPGLGQGRDPR